MTTVDVVIGCSASDDRQRRRVRRWVTARYLAAGYPVAIGSCDQVPWVKAEAYNRVAAESDADVLVVADADCVVSHAALATAVSMVRARRWVVPASSVRRLARDHTDAILALDPTTTDGLTGYGPPSRSHALLPGGGIVVVARDLWRQVGGFDPRFTDWGGEDYALGCALRSLSTVAPHVVAGDLWHLWHEPNPSGAYIDPENSALANRYRTGRFDSAAMTALIDEWRLP